MGENFKNWVWNFAMLIPRSLGTLGMLLNDTSRTLLLTLKDTSNIWVNYINKAQELLYEDLKELKKDGKLKRYHVIWNLWTYIWITGTWAAELLTALLVNWGGNTLKTWINGITNLRKILRYSVFNTKPVSKTAISYNSIKIGSREFKFDTKKTLIDWFSDWLWGESLWYMTDNKKNEYENRKVERENKRHERRNQRHGVTWP